MRRTSRISAFLFLAVCGWDGGARATIYSNFSGSSGPGSGGGLSPIPDQTVLANTSGGSAAPVANTVSQVKTLLGMQDSTNASITGGTITGINTATGSVMGMMSPADKTKLDNFTAFNEQVTSLSSPGAAIAINSLDGDVDGDYDVFCEMTMSTSGQIQGYLAGVLTGYAASDFGYSGGGVTRTDWAVGTGAGTTTFATGAVVFISGRLHARSGRPRTLNANVFSLTSGGTPSTILLDGYWSDTVTDVTWMQWSTSGSFAAGSFCRLTARETKF